MRLQLAKLAVRVGDTDHFQKIAGDGLMVVTPIASKGYNRSAGRLNAASEHSTG
jgi:NAD kinase